MISIGDKIVKNILFIISILLFFAIMCYAEEIYNNTCFILNFLENTKSIDVVLLNIVFQYEINLSLINEISNFLLIVDLIVFFYEMVK